MSQLLISRYRSAGTGAAYAVERRWRLTNWQNCVGEVPQPPRRGGAHRHGGSEVNYPRGLTPAGEGPD
eukprot:365152-Chlamydomonas_euryale.AAC.8